MPIPPGPFDVAGSAKSSKFAAHRTVAVRLRGRRLAEVIVVAVVLTALAACTPVRDAPGTGGSNELFGEIATFEVVAGRPGRIAIGLSTKDGRVLAGGTVRFDIAPASGGTGIASEATFRSVPETPPVSGAARIGRPSEGIGVYVADNVTVPAAGFWTVSVSGLPGRLARQHPEGSFEALAVGRVPAVGDRAPRTRNLTLASTGIDPLWLDSATPEGEQPDALLHSTVIADALAAHRPVVVVVSTPAYCTSKFCGPTTEVVRKLAERDRAAGADRAYVHLEVWRDFDKSVVNKAAAEWILPNGAEGREPWVWLVGSDGTIAARFDNVVPVDQLSAAVDALH